MVQTLQHQAHAKFKTWIKIPQCPYRPRFRDSLKVYTTETDRERHRQTDRQTDWQTDRRTNWVADQARDGPSAGRTNRGTDQPLKVNELEGERHGPSNNDFYCYFIVFRGNSTLFQKSTSAWGWDRFANLEWAIQYCTQCITLCTDTVIFTC